MTREFRDASSMTRRGFVTGAAAVGACVVATSAQAAETTPAAKKAVKEMSDTADTSDSTAALNDASVAQHAWSFEIAPEPIEERMIADVVSADVVVVGAGTSGLITAVSAAEAGLDVVVVTASAAPVARGGSNNAINCKAMEQAGVDPIKPFQIQKEIFYAGNQVDERKWYQHFNHSEEAMNWVIDLMEGAGYKVKVEQGTPSEDDYLYHESCSIGWEYGDDMVPDPDIPQGTGMMQPLLVRELARHLTEDLGCKVFYKTKGEQLVRETDAGKPGRVTAVVCSREDGTYARYEASKEVVLATGDFSANRDMMYRYAPSYAPYISDDIYDGETNYDVSFQYGGLYKGEGHQMGLWVGAAWQKVFPNCVMGGFYGPGPRNLYSNFLGLLVNRDGERFMNEDCLSPCAGMNNFGQPGKTVFAIWDTAYARQETVSGSWNNDSMHAGDAEEVAREVVASWDKAVAGGTMVKANTLEELIDELGLPKETLATVDRYNDLAKAGCDDDFHKPSEHLHPIEEGPFYGQSSGGMLVFLTVLGGLNTDAHMRVCDADDRPIPGLYNVGTMVGDMFATNYTFMTEGANYGANCITFGYLTGKYIAENE